MHSRSRKPERWEDYCRICRKKIYRLSSWRADFWVHDKTEVRPCNRPGSRNPDEVATPQEPYNGR